MKGALSTVPNGKVGVPTYSERPWVTILVLACLFSGGAWYESYQTKSLLDSDIWVHISTGEWILRNHTVPHTALFTKHTELEWVVPSWGFDTFFAYGVRLLRLRTIPLSVMTFTAVLAVVTFGLAKGWQENFWSAAGLTAASEYILLNFPPGPAMASAVFFAIELSILMRFRDSRNCRAIRWMPILLLVWANLDGQFLYGLLILGLYAIGSLLEVATWRHGEESWPKESGLSRFVLYGALSVVATLISPYFYAPYAVIGRSAIGPIGLAVLDNLHSMSFRQPQHYAVLLLVSFACVALGKQHCRDWFKVSLLAVCAAFAFRRQQDMWLATLAAVAVIADGVHGEVGGESPVSAHTSRRLEGLTVAAIVVAVFVVAAMHIPSAPILRSLIAKEFPVKAADFIRGHRLLPPLYNAHAWGAFLTWYLPEYPVSIDGRIEMYGRAINDSFFETSTGLRPPEQDLSIMKAQTFLLKKESRLNDAVSHLRGIETLYEDELAVVMKRNAATTAAETEGISNQAP